MTVENSPMNIDLDEVFETLIEFNTDIAGDALEIIGNITAELYGQPAAPGEIERQAERLLLEAFVPGRSIEIAPLTIIQEGEDFELNGTLIAPVLFNQGVIFDDNRFGDNLLTGVFLNDGFIDFNRGEDFVIGATGGISNGPTGVISTGDQLDLISGADSGVENVKGIFNPGGLIDSGNGNDRIVGNAVATFDVEGVENISGGLIKTGRGNDLIDGQAAALNEAAGIENDDFSTISTGLGNDFVFGVADDLTGLLDGGKIAGILNRDGSVISTGGGNDVMEGVAFADNSEEAIGGRVGGIGNAFSNISLGAGSDRVTGEAFSAGEQITSGIISIGSVDNQALLKLGNGDDFVLGAAISKGGSVTSGIELENSTIQSKGGNNLIEGEAVGGFFNSGILLDSSSTIKLGAGNDVVAGFAFDGIESNQGITNFGTIKLGGGDDIIESLDGDFGGDGTTRLGSGNDFILGFGTGNFNGGRGIDIIKLTTGIYEFENNILTRVDGVSMDLRSVERIAGLADDQSLLLQEGSVYIVNQNDMIELA
ncbi:hypothetical protein ACLM44_12565 [Synechococcus sp. W2B2]|uniref:hypothetical protein n=2 Tax=Synechococcus TaxID=1129 RepID=UPI00031934FD